MILVSFREADFVRLEKAWRAFYPARYHVTGDLIRSKTVEHPLFDWGASVIALDDEAQVLGFLAVKSPSGDRYGFGASDVSSINSIAFTNPVLGTDLLASCKKVLVNRGMQKLSFGGDMGHFFPGVPEDCGTLRDFLTVAGFESSGSYVDLERDLSTYIQPDFSVRPFERGGVEVKRLSQGDDKGLEAWLKREFPGRWELDTLAKVRESGEPEDIFVLAVNAKIEGFAYTQQWKEKLPVAGAVWNLDLGPNWGGLGPIGVSEGVRGQGLGHALLGAALAGLRDAGVKRCIIDWTTLVDFYGAHGFEVSRRYAGFSLSL